MTKMMFDMVINNPAMIAFVVSEVLALLPIKYNGIAHAVIVLLSKPK